MTPTERLQLETLDSILRSSDVREKIEPIIARVRVELARKREALMTWEPLPLEIFGGALPPTFSPVGYSCCARVRILAPNVTRIVISA